MRSSNAPGIHFGIPHQTVGANGRSGPSQQNFLRRGQISRKNGNIFRSLLNRILRIRLPGHIGTRSGESTDAPIEAGAATAHPTGKDLMDRNVQCAA